MKSFLAVSASAMALSFTYSANLTLSSAFFFSFFFLSCSFFFCMSFNYYSFFIFNCSYFFLSFSLISSSLISMALNYPLSACIFFSSAASSCSTRDDSYGFLSVLRYIRHAYYFSFFLSSYTYSELPFSNSLIGSPRSTSSHRSKSSSLIWAY